MSNDGNNGYIGLFRDLLDKPIWQQSTPEQKTVLITLLLMANHKEKEWEWGGKQFKASPGQFITSLENIQKKSGKGISQQNIRTAIKRFEKYEFLTNESTKTGRMITIVNWGVYQVEKLRANKAIDNHLTDDSQTPNKDLTPNNNVNNVNNESLVPKNKFSDDDIKIILASELSSYIKRNNPECGSHNLQSWAADFDKMIRIDNRTVDRIREIMKFSQEDGFWKSNILSASKLRKQFNALILKSKSSSTSSGGLQGVSAQEMLKKQIAQKMSKKEIGT